MIKRMTLLAKKEGMSTSDFRAHWAGPHAQLALCMQGITEYRHNRVDKTLWVHGGGAAAYSADGIVELCFADADLMRSAQASLIGQKWIPDDELLFLKGWTLCVVDSVGDAPGVTLVKVLVPFHGVQCSREALWAEMQSASQCLDSSASLNWTVSTACRQHLWSEPHPPEGIACFRFSNVAQAHAAFESAGLLPSLFERHTHTAVAYLVNTLSLK